jgi:ribosomal protein S27AE
MFKRCLVCHSPFQANESLEHFPLGTRIAYDPSRGRLWAVCKECKRWSLAPIEERWEALEELEKLVRDRSRLLSQTENISLLRAGRLEIVRVGRANLAEQAWWRYGKELTRRRQKFKTLSTAGAIGAGAAIWGGMATGGMSFIAAWLLWDNLPNKIPDAARWLRFGGDAWRGRSRCAKCGYTFTRVAYRRRGQFVLYRADLSGPAELSYKCPRCGEFRDGGLQLKGPEAEHTLRRVLAYHHFDGADDRTVTSATRLIQEAGSPEDLSRILLKNGKRLGDLGRTGGIALEIAANEASEQRLLELELAELEAHWRIEEELAAIIDGELTPLPLLEAIRRKVVGQS